MSYLVKLYDQPDVVVYLLFMLASAALAAACCTLARPTERLGFAKDQLDLAMRTSAAMVSALTLTLAFCAVQARTQTNDAQKLVAQEVAAISGLARMADRMGAGGEALRGRVNDYVASIVADEFPRMADNGRAPDTQRRAEALEHAAYAAIAGVSDSMATDLLQQADNVDSAREDRLHAATIALPKAFWMLVLVLLTMLAGTGALYPRRGHVVGMLAIQAAGVGALVAFVFLMDQPFRGNLSVSGAPYEALQRSLVHRSEIAAAARRGMLAIPSQGPPGATMAAE